MSNRQRLPTRRGSITFDLNALGLTFTVTASRFDHGEIGEVFIQTPYWQPDSHQVILLKPNGNANGNGDDHS